METPVSLRSRSDGVRGDGSGTATTSEKGGAISKKRLTVPGCGQRLKELTMTITSGLGVVVPLSVPLSVALSVALSLVSARVPASNAPIKNIVLVHGAWVDASGWKSVYD